MEQFVCTVNVNRDCGHFDAILQRTNNNGRVLSSYARTCFEFLIGDKTRRKRSQLFRVEFHRFLKFDKFRRISSNAKHQKAVAE